MYKIDKKVDRENIVVKKIADTNSNHVNFYTNLITDKDGYYIRLQLLFLNNIENVDIYSLTNSNEENRYAIKLRGLTKESYYNVIGICNDIFIIERHGQYSSNCTYKISRIDEDFNDIKDKTIVYILDHCKRVTPTYGYKLVDSLPQFDSSRDKLVENQDANSLIDSSNSTSN